MDLDEEDNNRTLDLLPHEVLEYILCLPNLVHTDVCNFGRVCEKFHIISNGNKIWRKKYKSRWPHLYKFYDLSKQYNWKEEFKIRYDCGSVLRKKVFMMSSKFYTYDEMSQEAFTDFLKISDHPMTRYFLIEELEFILHDDMPSNNLTVKYYAQRVLRYIRHECLQITWKTFLSLPPSLQILERGAILLAQWCQPTERISEEAVTSQLEYLTQLIKNELQIRYPKHPVIQMEMVKTDVALEHSLWEPAECRSILSCINAVLFNQQQFVGNRDDYYSAQNSYIDQVLCKKMGIPITLCIIYASIARRLGVVCQPVNFPGHFLLKWQEHPSLPPDQKYTFIDVFDYGKFLCQKDCKDLVPGYSPMAENWYNTIEPVQVFKRMCWNLVDVGRQQESMGDGLMCLRNALELLAILSPDDVEHQLLLARVYLHLNINLTKVMSLLQGISTRDPASIGIVDYVCQAAQSQMALQRSHQQTKKVKIKHRNNNVNIEYAVGMIMRHKKYNYICVIYGWDPICEASRDWIYQMGVYNLPHREKQPFYNVLVEDGSNRYAAQENLEITEYPKPISHPEIGKYFQHYCSTHYVPNEEKESEYPDDKSIREEVIAKHFPQERQE